MLLFFVFAICNANYDVALKHLQTKLEMHVPRQNLENLFCVHGEEGFSGLTGNKFQSNQISATQNITYNHSDVGEYFECNPKKTIIEAFNMLKDYQYTNVSFPRGPVGPVGESGYGIREYVSNFFYENCIEPHIPDCNYTITLFNHFARIGIEHEKNCPPNLEGWMGPAGQIGTHQIQFIVIGNKEQFCKNTNLLDYNVRGISN